MHQAQTRTVTALRPLNTIHSASVLESNSYIRTFSSVASV